MIPRLKWLWQSIWASLWAVPFAMVCVAFVLAIAATSVRIDIGDDPVWFLYSGDAEQAPQFLSNLMTAMITMATLAISITIVVLTLAAQQLGPRLISSFIGDRRTQIALGLFVGTVVYLLLVLRSSYGAGDSSPNLAVTIGTALALVSVLSLLLFVHHLARAIVADNVIRRVGERLDKEIERLLPERGSPPSPPRPQSIRARGAPLRTVAGGYVEAIDFGRLQAAARSIDATIELRVRAGHHVIAQSLIGWIEPGAKADIALENEIAGCIILGSERTPLQDLEYSIRQLVEIAVRALSPGINDPFTAIAVLDRLTHSIRCAMRRGPAQDVWADDDGRIRVVVPVSTFDGIVDAAFHQIRQVSGGLPAVLIRLVDNLVELAALADHDQKQTLFRHLRLALNAGRRDIAEPADLQSMENRAREALPENGATSAADST
jgi:uncharacterized membrane protein